MKQQQNNSAPPLKRVYTNKDGVIDGADNNEYVEVNLTQTKEDLHPYSILFRGHGGKDAFVLNASRPVQASLNGGDGNDAFYIGDVAQNSRIAINGDGGVDRVRIANPASYVFQYDKNHKITITSKENGSTITLSGVEEFQYLSNGYEASVPSNDLDTSPPNKTYNVDIWQALDGTPPNTPMELKTLAFAKIVRG